MPEICRFNGIVISMFFMDNDRHHKPHIHISYGSDKAVMDFYGELLEGSLEPRIYKSVMYWVSLHEDELYMAWNNAVRGLPIGKISPPA